MERGLSAPSLSSRHSSNTLCCVAATAQQVYQGWIAAGLGGLEGKERIPEARTWALRFKHLRGNKWRLHGGCLLTRPSPCFSLWTGARPLQPPEGVHVCAVADTGESNRRLKVKKLTLILGALALFVVQPVAGQWTPTEMPVAPWTETILNYEGLYGTIDGVNYNPIAYGVYTGPYKGAFGADPTSSQFTMYCVDFSRTVSSGHSWSFDWGRWDGYVEFQVAFLASLFASEEVSVSDFAAIHGAIWYLTDGPGSDSEEFGFHNDNIQLYVDQASDTWSLWESGDYAGPFNPNHWYFLTDVDGNRQRFVAQYSVPEPGIILLLLSGLLGVAFVARRRASQLS